MEAVNKLIDDLKKNFDQFSFPYSVTAEGDMLKIKQITRWFSSRKELDEEYVTLGVEYYAWHAGLAVASRTREVKDGKLRGLNFRLASLEMINAARLVDRLEFANGETI